MYRLLLDQQLDGADRVGRLGLQTVDHALVAFAFSSLGLPHAFTA
jgi:hypothetical protein